MIFPDFGDFYNFDGHVRDHVKHDLSAYMRPEDAPFRPKISNGQTTRLSDSGTLLPRPQASPGLS
jgi:hypothetical protein